jgi:hypothetical protein
MAEPFAAMGYRIRNCIESVIQRTARDRVRGRNWVRERAAMIVIYPYCARVLVDIEL